MTPSESFWNWNVQATSLSSWREIVRDRLNDVQFHVPDDASFTASMSCKDLLGTRFVRIAAGRHCASNRNRHPARSGGDYILLSLLEEGEAKIRQGEREVALKAGDMAIYDTGGPYRFVADHPFVQTVLRIERDDLARRVSGLRDFTVRRISGNRSLGRIASAHVREVHRQLDRIETGCEHFVQRTMFDIIACALSDIDPDHDILTHQHQRLLLQRMSIFVEDNLFEWIGWQDAAMMSESAGTKMHVAHNLLFRNNVVRHIRHANGLWLDIGNANDRITGNVFADIPGNVNPHAVHIEGSDALNQIDNNIFDHLTGGILIRDTNNVIIAYNLFLDCAEVCVDTVSGINGPRPIMGHTNDVHNLMVHDNVFFKMGRSAIEFNNGKNDADGNVYGASDNPRFMQPFLRVKFPEPAEWDNLESWREQRGWDKNGAMAQITADLDPDKLQLTMTVKGDVKPAAAFKGIDSDFFGHTITGERMPGPFRDLTSAAARNIDPR